MPIHKSQISGTIITFNSGRHLSKVLNAIKNYVDEIVIVDSGSQDDTLDIARQFNARIINIQWQGYGHARNIAFSEAKHQYVLFPDADEVFTTKALNTLLETWNDSYASASFKLVNYYRGKKLKFGIWKPTHKIRFCNKELCKWDNRPVHEQLTIHGKTLKINKGEIKHYTVDSIYDHLEKIRRYAIAGSKTKRQPSKLKVIGSATWTFLKGYVFNLGFLDGYDGLCVHLMQSMETFLKYELARESNAD